MADRHIIIKANELYHYGVFGQRKGKRRWQNKDGSLTYEGRIHYGVGQARSKDAYDESLTKIGRKRYTNDATGYANAARDNTKHKYYSNSSLYEHMSKNIGIDKALEAVKADRLNLHDSTQRERKEYSKLFSDTKLLKKISDQAYQEFSKGYKDQYSDKEMLEDKEFWDSHVKYASEHDGRTHESYIIDSILDTYYKSLEGKEYKQAVDDYLNTIVSMKEKFDTMAKEYLQEQYDKPIKRNSKYWANRTVGQMFTQQFVERLQEKARTEGTFWDDPVNMIPDGMYNRLTEEQKDALYWLS